MKPLKIIGHPVVLMIIYLLLIIEGDEFGGFYLLYLLLALPHGALYAILAAIGLGCVTIGFNIDQTKYNNAKPILYLGGFALMISSLFLFFAKGNKWATFDTGVPLSTFILFGICSLFFLLYTVSLLIKPKEGKDSSIQAVS